MVNHLKIYFCFGRKNENTKDFDRRLKKRTTRANAASYDCSEIKKGCFLTLGLTMAWMVRFKVFERYVYNRTGFSIVVHFIVAPLFTKNYDLK